MAKRKIGFYYLFLKDTSEGLEYSVLDSLSKIFSFLIESAPVERKFDLYNDKFAFLDQYQISKEPDGTKLLEFLYKSAKHSYRAPLLNRSTVVARENPKTLEEGEQVKTHGLIKFKDGDAICFLETGLGMLSFKNIIDYLNFVKAKYNSQQDDENELIKGEFYFDMIPRDDFREVLENMNRVLLAEVYVDNYILGSDVLNFSNPSEELKQEIVLSLKAEKKKNIKQHIYEILDKMSGTQTKIHRIRVKGKLPNDNESIIDTSFIIKKEYVDAQQNEETGEYNTLDMFSQLKTLAQEY